MRPAVLSVVASLLFCGATATLIATSAQAISPSPARPVMVALAGAPHLETAAPAAEAGAPPPRPAAMRERRAALCGEFAARAAARLAYLETRLDLTAAQKPLFERWKATRMAAAGRTQDRCKARVQAGRPSARPSPMERLDREEARLKQRLADIEAERPALSALYDSLSDTQKTELARGGMMRRGMGMMMMRRMDGPMGGGMGGGGMMRRGMGGPMGGGMGPMMPPADPDGAPPPQ